MNKKAYIDSKKSQISLAQASLRNQQLQDQIDQLVQEKLNVFGQEIRKIVEQHQDSRLPLSIFKSASSTLEIIVKYLHEAERRNLADIALHLQRDQRTIWHAYQRSRRKKSGPVRERSTKKSKQISTITIPVSLFARRQFSPLEVLASYLHEQHRLSFAEISRALSLSPKTVWTVYQRKLSKEQQPHHREQHKNNES